MSVRIAVSLLLLLALTGCADDRREERLRAAGPRPTLQALLKVADASVGARKFRQCAGCHTISKGAPDTGGPNLHGIFGQEFGRNSARFGYTAALRDTGRRWDAQTLDAWMENPQKVVPGTTMQFGGMADPLDRADLIAYLRSRSD
ncbi:c-type cytochrome [Caenibius sp. WL]|uniref:c-type cytochrome n=1 Tax=Caenibius sp. WL TaxID=2872646 RepID=UPI001C98F4CE|nr:c-type cytochrome [Caenibius sp. WL]